MVEIILLLFSLIATCTCACPERRIPGPRNVNDRIAIVGGGPAGIHMALRLKEKGRFFPQ